LPRDNLRVAGSLFFLAGVQFLLMLAVSEALYPGYSVSMNTISDLGATCAGSSCIIHQPASLVFESAALLLGFLGLAGVYFLTRDLKGRLAPVLIVLSSLGAVGVAVLPETAGVAHTLASLVTFLFAGLSAVATYRLQRPPLSYFSIALGCLTLTALAFYGAGVYLSLGEGGMERVMAYPALLWLLGLGAQLVAGSPAVARAPLAPG
jgi:hypothetical membrane protein